MRRVSLVLAAVFALGAGSIARAATPPGVPIPYPNVHIPAAHSHAADFGLATAGLRICDGLEITCGVEGEIQ